MRERVTTYCVAEGNFPFAVVPILSSSSSEVHEKWDETEEDEAREGRGSRERVTTYGVAERNIRLTVVPILSSSGSEVKLPRGFRYVCNVVYCENTCADCVANLFAKRVIYKEREINFFLRGGKQNINTY